MIIIVSRNEWCWISDVIEKYTHVKTIHRQTMTRPETLPQRTPHPGPSKSVMNASESQVRVPKTFVCLCLKDPPRLKCVVREVTKQIIRALITPLLQKRKQKTSWDYDWSTWASHFFMTALAAFFAMMLATFLLLPLRTHRSRSSCHALECCRFETMSYAVPFNFK